MTNNDDLRAVHVKIKDHSRARDPARVLGREARAREAAARRAYREAHPGEHYEKSKRQHMWYERHKSDPDYQARMKRSRDANKALRRANGKDHNAMLQYVYGISLEEHRALSISQNHECYVCGRARKLLVDHDHITGVIRGLACLRCNSSVGSLGDSPETLRWVAALIEARS